MSDLDRLRELADDYIRACDAPTQSESLAYFTQGFAAQLHRAEFWKAVAEWRADFDNIPEDSDYPSGQVLREWKEVARLCAMVREKEGL